MLLRMSFVSFIVTFGFGILFIGMDMMGDGLKPLAELPAFTNIIMSLNNPEEVEKRKKKRK